MGCTRDGGIWAGETARRRGLAGSRYRTPGKKNPGIGAEEKVQRGKILVEKHSDESEDTVYSMGKWEITVDFLPDSGPQGIYE